MEAHLRKTIDDLVEKLKGLEKQAADTKRLVNSLCELGGETPMFSVVDDAPTLTTIKADTFYGQAFATAATAYLRMRKAKNMGPATVSDIYDALKRGGYQFEAKNEDYAKRGIRHSLGKNSSTFHKVPNGEFGLLEWYPDVKKKPKPISTATEDEDSEDEDSEDEDSEDEDGDENSEDEEDDDFLVAIPIPSKTPLPERSAAKPKIVVTKTSPTSPAKAATKSDT